MMLEEKRKRQLQEQTVQMLQHEQIRVEYNSAMKLQALWRRKQSVCIKERIQLENESACMIQSAWRW
eukprot:7245832-Ditylum_brightwellii.AAC.1